MSSQKLRIGYRKLFEAVDCELKIQSTFPQGFMISENKIWFAINFGENLMFGKGIGKGSKYITIQDGTPKLFSEFTEYTPFSNMPNGIYTEIFSFEEFPVEDSDLDELEKNNVQVRDKYLKIAEDNRDKYKKMIDFVSGLIGLKFHRQFVVEPIIENPIVQMPNGKYFHHIYGTAAELLERITLKEPGIKRLHELLEVVSKANKNIEKYSLIFYWLLRAWTERESVAKFLDLFLPLEITAKTFSPQTNSNKDELISLVEQKIENEESKRLIVELLRNSGEPKPGLVDNFIKMAKTYSMNSWENDIRAFKRFNNMRNRLLHGGDKRIVEIINLKNENETNENIVRLEDIVERYVSKFIFGDEDIYPSRWRKI
jgi:hypothetical protein